MATSLRRLERGGHLGIGVDPGDGVDVVDERASAPDTAPSTPPEPPSPLHHSEEARPPPPTPDQHAALALGGRACGAGSYGLNSPSRRVERPIGLESRPSAWQANARATCCPAGSSEPLQASSRRFLALDPRPAAVPSPLAPWALQPARISNSVGRLSRGKLRARAAEHRSRPTPWDASGPSPRCSISLHAERS